MFEQSERNDQIIESRLKSIIENNRNILLELGITIDEIKNSDLGFVENAEQVDLFSSKTFARITLFESCRLYIQILDIETEKTVFFWDDILEEKENLEDFIMQAIKKM